MDAAETNLKGALEQPFHYSRTVKIIVFISKNTGLALAETLRLIPDEYLFVIGPRDSNLLERSLESMGFDYMKLDAFDAQVYPPGSFDWLLNLWGSHIFTPIELRIAINTLNVHPSYLPYSKGSDPVLWSQLMDLPQGATLHAITQQVDAGPIYARKHVETSPVSIGRDIYDEVVNACIDLFASKWPDIRTGKIRATNPKEDGSSLPNRRSRTLTHQVREYEQFDNSQRNLLKWLLAYSYSPEFAPIIRLGDIEYKVVISLLTSLNSDIPEK